MTEVMYFKGVWTKSNTIGLVGPLSFLVLYTTLYLRHSTPLTTLVAGIVWIGTLAGILFSTLVLQQRKMKLTTDGNICIPGITMRKFNPNTYRYNSANKPMPVLMFTRSNIKTKYQVVEPQEIDMVKEKRRSRSIKDLLEASHANDLDKTLCIVFKTPLKYDPLFKKLAMKMPNHEIHRIYVSFAEPQKTLAYI